MKKLTKVFTLLLTAAILCVSILPLFVSAEYGISPRYVNTNTCTCDLNIINGNAYVSVSYNAKSSVFSHAIITLKVQKRFLGVFWSDVAEWTDYCYDIYGYVSNNTPLENTGTYRAVFTVEIYGKDGSVDTIEDKITSTYE